MKTSKKKKIKCRLHTFPASPQMKCQPIENYEHALVMEREIEIYNNYGHWKKRGARKGT